MFSVKQTLLFKGAYVPKQTDQSDRNSGNGFRLQVIQVRGYSAGATSPILFCW